MPDNLNISDWLHQIGEIALSRETLEGAALQLAVVAAMVALAAGIRLSSDGLTDRLAARLARAIPADNKFAELRGILWLLYAWLLLVPSE